MQMREPFVKLRIVIAVFLGLLFAGMTNGQVVRRGSNASIKIDSVTRLPDNPIPFDQSFSMVLTPRNPQNITNIQALQLVKDKKGNPDYKFPPNDIGIVGYKIMGQQVVIDFYPIKANKSFDIVIQRKLDSANLDAFLDFAAFVANSRAHPADYTAAQIRNEESLYVTFYNSLLPVIQLSPQAQVDKRNSHLNLATMTYDFLYQADCQAVQGNTRCPGRSLENQLSQSISSNIFAIIGTSVAPPVYQAGNDFSSDLQTISQSYLANKWNDQTIGTVIAIWDDGKQDQLFRGFISADYKPAAKPNKMEDIAERGKNFQTTLQKLQGLYDTVTRLSNEVIDPDAAFDRAAKYLGLLIDAFKTAQKLVDQNTKDLSSTLAQTWASIYSEYYVTSNNGFKDLQTASGSFLSPQIGLSFLRMPKNIGGSQVIPKITLGVNINCKPINKSLIRADIPDKNIWNYFSAFVGITFGAFSDTEYSNLLASNSLLAGINYRLNRSVYLSLGGSAFKLQNKNPVINAFHPAFGVYASALIDIDVAGAASNFVSFFTK
jgi:hypothetical protein